MDHLNKLLTEVGLRTLHGVEVPMIDAAIAAGRFSAIPGSAFGAPGCIRFGYAGIPLDGIERLGQYLPEVLASVARPGVR